MNRLLQISEAYYPYILLLFWAVLTLPTLAVAPLFDYDETIYAQTAVDMMRHGEWVVPIANGEQFFEKPPFTYYLMDVCFSLLGENAFAARLPSALFTLFTALLLLHFGRRFQSPKFGLSSAIIFLTMLEVGLLAHAAILDAVLNFFIAAALLYYLLWRRFKIERDALIAAVMMGAAVSIKGPVGVVVPLLVIALDRLLAKDFLATCRALPWLPCVGLFLLAATPWYLMILWQQGSQFLYEFLVVHNLGRAMNPMQGHGGKWHYYLVVFMVSVLPWLGWFIWSQWRFWSVRDEQGAPLWQLSRFVLLWIVVVVVLFSFVQTKLPHYISCIYPGAALLLAAMLLRAGETATVPRMLYWGTALLLLPVALLLLFFPLIYPQIVSLVHHPRAVAIVTQDILPSNRVVLSGGVLIAAVAALAWWGRVARGQHILRFAMVGVALQSALFIGVGGFAGRLIQAPTMTIAALLQQLPADMPIYSYNLNAPSISFYARRSYQIIHGGDILPFQKVRGAYVVVMRRESLADLPFLEQRAPRIDQGGYLLYIIKP